eukprot:m.63899 g.63899  ORF g.63899 m.63899 type:complete len:904 (-) comp23361_c0_seq1:265-2976(-)
MASQSIAFVRLLQRVLKPCPTTCPHQPASSSRYTLGFRGHVPRSPLVVSARNLSSRSLNDRTNVECKNRCLKIIKHAHTPGGPAVENYTTTTPMGCHTSMVRSLTTCSKSNSSDWNENSEKRTKFTSFFRTRHHPNPSHLFDIPDEPDESAPHYDKLEQQRTEKDLAYSPDTQSVQSELKTAPSFVQKKLDEERKRLKSLDTLDSRPDMIPPELVGNLREQRKQMLADDQLKMIEDDRFRLGAIQSGMPRSTSLTLLLSLFGNMAICGAKFYGWSRTGHSAMLSEAVHTLVDVGNQAILGYGLREAGKAPDKFHQYGYGRAAFFYSLVTALSTFGFGAVYTAYHGVTVLLYPPEHLETLPETWAILGASLAVDGFVLHTAMKDVRRRAIKTKVSVLQWVSSFKDPFTVAVIFEDGAAVLGVIAAALGIGLTTLTGSPVWDGLASLVISGLLGTVSAKLILLNRSFLLGKPVEAKVIQEIRTILMRRGSVDSILSAQSQWIGPSAFAYSAEVDFDGTYLAAQVYQRYEEEIKMCVEAGNLDAELKWLLPCFAEDVTRALENEVRAIQAEIREKFTEASFIEIIPDSSQTNKSALDAMGKLSRRAEHDVLTALMNTLPGEEQNHDDLYELGKVYEAMGFDEKAIDQFKGCLALRREHFGLSHPEVALVLFKLGLLYNRGGKYKKAMEVLNPAIRTFGSEQVGGQANPEFAETYNRCLQNLAYAYQHTGQSGRARPLLEEVLENARKLHVFDDLRLASTLELLVEVYLRSSDSSRVIDLLEELRKIYKAEGMDVHDTSLEKVLLRLGERLKFDYQLQRAEQILTEHLHRVEARTGPSTLETATALVALADVLCEQCDRGRAVAAFGLLNRAHVIRTSLLPPGSPATYDVLRRLRSLQATFGLNATS